MIDYEDDWDEFLVDYDRWNDDSYWENLADYFEEEYRNVVNR